MLGLGHGIHTDTPGTGKVFHNNYSILFDGVNDHITIHTVAGNIDKDKGTYSVWVKFNSTSTTGIILKSSVDTSNHITLAYDGSSNEMLFIYKAGGSAKKVEHSVTVEGTGNWVHLAMTWDASQDELKGYINGSQVSSTVGSLSEFSGTIDAVTSGKNSLANDTYFVGYIDEISAFDEVVDIPTLYNEGSPKDVEFSGLAGLIGYWRFTEGTGTSVADEATASNTATLVNGAAWSIVTP